MTYLTEVQDKKNEDPTPQEADETDEVVFDQAPVRVVCPHCGLSIITFIEHETTWVTYVACAGLLIVLGWAGLCIVPIVYPLFKDVVHHCPRCLCVLATRSRVAFTSFKQEVMSIRLGSCVVVLARKYVLMLLVLTAIIGSIHFVRSSGGPRVGVDAVQRNELVPLTWQDFMNDCGFKSYLGNPIHVKMAFSDKFKNRTLHWEGVVHHVEDGLSFLWFNQKGAVYVRMEPSQFPSKRDMADLVLLYNDGDAVGKETEKLKRGTLIGFDATMVEVGKRGNPHVMVVWELQVLQSLTARPETTALPEKTGAVDDDASPRKLEEARARANAVNSAPGATASAGGDSASNRSSLGS